ncbi:MAG: hypothetical protein KDC90_03255 [Ignavibacteriae bacterium]|nr:hypothetical protein [Ignavibacteriota bacterium]
MKDIIMDMNSILLLSTIKTEDARLTDRFSREVRSKKELIENLFEFEFSLLNKLDINEVVILNQNSTKITTSDLNEFVKLNDISYKKNEVYLNLLFKARILNCNDFQCSSSDCVNYFFALNNRNIILIEKLLDTKFLHFIRTNNTNSNNFILLGSDLIIYKNNINEKLRKIYSEIYSRKDLFKSLDSKNLYSKYLFELIDEIWIENYKKFLTNKESNALYYIYGEDEDLLESIKLKTIKEIGTLTYLSSFDPEIDEIVIDDYILIELQPGKELQNLISKIRSLIGSGYSFILIDNSKYPRIQMGHTIYIPNYKELMHYHTFFFIYYLHCYIYSEKLYKIIDDVRYIDLFNGSLNKLKSVSELIGFFNSIDFDRLKNDEIALVKNYLLSTFEKYVDELRKIHIPNKITYKDSEWKIIFKSHTYSIKAENDKYGLRFLAIMLKESSEFRPSKLRNLIQGMTVGDEEDSKVLRAAFYRILDDFKEIEKLDPPTEDLSEYLKTKLKFIAKKKKREFFIRSVDIQPGEWEFDFPDWLKI